LIDRLTVPSSSGSKEDAILAELRKQIDDFDTDILALLGKRMETAREIGRYKKAEKMDALQLERWKLVVEDRLEKGKELGLSNDFLLKLLYAIHEEALKRQV